MSTGARSHTSPESAGREQRRPVSLPRLDEMKAQGEPIVMVTAYDYPSATVAEAAGVDVVLVGDSAANVVLGYPDTKLVSMEEMLVLGKAVRRGLKTVARWSSSRPAASPSSARGRSSAPASR